MSPTPARNAMAAEDPMVIEVLSELCHLTGKNFDPEDTRGLIAAVLDGLPREVVEDGARRRCRQEAQHRYPGDLAAVLEYVDRCWQRYVTEVEGEIDAALAAARRSVLGHE